MKNINYNGFLSAARLVVLAALVPFRCIAEPIYLAGNYDGANYDLSFYEVGDSDGHSLAVGAKLTVAGSGNFELNRLILPLRVFSGNPDPNNYQLSLVSDSGNYPSGDVVWSGTPQGVGTTAANYSFDLSGTVQGGHDYWVLFGATALDGGNYAWCFHMPLPNYEFGELARRWSDGGVPTGPWTISTGWGSVQPAFLIEGTAVIPEPNGFVLLALGVASLITCGWRRRKASHKF